MTFWLMYAAVAAAIAAITAATTLKRTRQGQVMRLLSDSMHERLSRWAAANGWTIEEGTDVRLADVLDRVAGLAGEPGDWDFRVRDTSGGGEGAIASALKKWEFGTVLTQRSQSGRIVLVSCWREGTGDHHCIGAVSTGVELSPFTLDRLANGKLYRDGEPALDADVDAALDDLGRPARLRLISDEVVLSVPGQLSPELADELTARLVRLRNAVPVPPGSGPMR